MSRTVERKCIEAVSPTRKVYEFQLASEGRKGLDVIELLGRAAGIEVGQLCVDKLGGAVAMEGGGEVAAISALAERDEVLCAVAN